VFSPSVHYKPKRISGAKRKQIKLYIHKCKHIENAQYFDFNAVLTPSDVDAALRKRFFFCFFKRKAFNLLIIYLRNIQFRWTKWRLL